MIAENLETVRSNIKDACMQSNRNPEDVRLIAVSKTQPVPVLQEAYDCGCRDFGENKVQEILAKYDQLPHDIRWHMIGHLQRNKVKYIIDKVCLIHSVDSLSLAREISKEAVKKNLCMPILLEINIAEEETKYGVSCDDVLPLVTEVAALPNIVIKGLMCVAPEVEISEENRPLFQKMREIFIDIQQKNIDNVCMEELSMGMTGDYPAAIMEGATYVRVGTGIFGRRNYAI